MHYSPRSRLSYDRRHPGCRGAVGCTQISSRRSGDSNGLRRHFQPTAPRRAIRGVATAASRRALPIQGSQDHSFDRTLLSPAARIHLFAFHSFKMFPFPSQNRDFSMPCRRWKRKKSFSRPQRRCFQKPRLAPSCAWRRASSAGSNLGSPFENRFRTNFPLVKELFEPAGAVAFRYGSPLRSFQRVTRFASRSNSCSSPISASKSLSGTMFGPSEGA